MKNIFLFSIVSLLLISCRSEEEKVESDFYEALESISYKPKRDFKDFIKTANAIEGFPKVFEPHLDKINYQFLDYYPLETKNDTVQVYVGSLLEDNIKKNWFCLVINDSINDYKYSSFNKSRHEIFKKGIGNDFSSDILFKTKNHSFTTGLKIKFLDTIKHKLEYSWRVGFEPKDSIIFSKYTKPLSIGDKLPKIELNDIDGVNIDINDLKKDLLVVFWCDFQSDICLEQIPYLNQLAVKYANDNVKFLAITNNKIDDAKRYLENNTFKYDIAFVEESSKELFGNGSSLNFVVDDNNVISFFRQGICYSCKTIFEEIDTHLQGLLIKLK